MKKTLSLILAMVMMITAAAAFAETPAERNGLFSLFGGLLGGGEGTEGSGLDSLFDGLMGEGTEGSGLGGLDSLFDGLMGEGTEGSGLDSLFNGLMGEGTEGGGLGSLDSLFEGLMGEGTEGSGLGNLESLFNGLMSRSGESTEGGSLGSLFSKLMGRLGLSEDFSLSSLVQPLLQKLGSLKNVKLPEIIDALKQKFSGITRGSEGGAGFDLSSLLGLFGSETGGTESIGDDDLAALLGLLLGGDSGDDFDLDKLLEAYRNSPEYQEYLARIEARKVYLNEKYAELEKGDEQVVIASTVTNFDTNDPDVEFGYFALANYKADGKDLIMLNCKGNVEILTYAKQEDGTFKVVESIVAEEGDGQDACIQEMCDAFGVTLKDYNEHLDLMDYEEQGCLLDFLGEHPEYERIEYMGELKTKDDLEAMQDAFWEAYIAALGVGGAE